MSGAGTGDHLQIVAGRPAADRGPRQLCLRQGQPERARSVRLRAQEVLEQDGQTNWGCGGMQPIASR